jgi:hypothetical protein
MLNGISTLLAEDDLFKWELAVHLRKANQPPSGGFFYGKNP